MRDCLFWGMKRRMGYNHGVIDKGVRADGDKSDLITYCLTYKDVYEDYPFRDHEWTVIRHRGNKRVFAWIYRREGQVCINLKCAPQWIEFWRKAYSGVRPGYHLNKKHWNTVVLDGSVPDEDIKRMIGESYDLTGDCSKKR